MRKQVVAAASAVSLVMAGAALGAQAASAAPQPQAAAPSLTYSGSASASVLDLTVLGKDGNAHVAEATVGASKGSVDSARSPRSIADAANLQLGLFTGNPPSPALLAHTHQEAPPDNPTADQKTVVPLHIPGLLDLDVSTAISQARWAGDGDCFAGGPAVERSTVSTAEAELLGIAGLNAGLLKVTNGVTTGQNVRVVQVGQGQPREVVSQAIGSAAEVQLLNGAIDVQVARAPSLTAVATGKTGGAGVAWDAPLLTINGSPLTVTNSPLKIVSPTNPLLSVELTLGQETNESVSQDGTHASADATLLHVKIMLLGLTIAQADLFPLSASATAPVGGVVCPIDALIDTDGDGLPDVDEISGDKNPFVPHATDPNDADSDDDGINDGAEVSGSGNKYDGTPTNPNSNDTDGDGLKDGEEAAGFDVPGAGHVFTNPNNKDTDGDTLGDKAEVDGTSNAFDGKRTNPVSPDTDGDGLRDDAENTKRGANKVTDPNNKDTDGDTLTDGQEVSGSLNPFGRTSTDDTTGDATDPTKADSDGDGLTDGQEIPDNAPGSLNTSFNKQATDPNKADTDGDGLTDGDEETGAKELKFGHRHTNPNVADTDKDGLTDGQEETGSQNKFADPATDPTISDTDGDGLSDGQEELAALSLNGKFNKEATDPNVKDTDKGSVADGIEEIASGTNPNDPKDDVATPFAFSRLAGTSRYDTSAKVALTFGHSPVAILASGESTGYADALSGNYFAGTRNAPMLLTRRGSTPSVTLSALNTLGVQTVYVMGGPAAITPSQVDGLRSHGFSVVRVAGANRYDTNAQVITAGGTASSDTAIVATGQDFPDALASGPLSYNEGMPLALTKQNDIPDDVVNALRVARVTKVLIVGGTGAVGQAVENELNSAGITVTKRFAGANRSLTSTLIAQYAIDTFSFAKTAVDVASGAEAGTGSDALSGSSLAGKTDRPLLITATANSSADLVGYLKSHASTLFTGTIFGGTGAVSQGSEDLMEKTVNDNR